MVHVGRHVINSSVPVSTRVPFNETHRLVLLISVWILIGPYRVKPNRLVRLLSGLGKKSKTWPHCDIHLLQVYISRVHHVLPLIRLADNGVPMGLCEKNLWGVLPSHRFVWISSHRLRDAFNGCS